MNINFKEKYLKYKKKYLELKNNLQGGKTEEEKQKMVLLRFELLKHGDIRRLGPKKIVATPKSGSEPVKFVNMWNELNVGDKYWLNWLTKTIYPGEKGWELGVFVRQPAPDAGNLIIFYCVEYLNLLAKVSDKTIDELLEIFSVAQNENKFNLDLIKIGFGDIFGNGVSNGPLQTSQGNEILKKYLEGLEDLENELKHNIKIRK